MFRSLTSKIMLISLILAVLSYVLVIAPGLDCENRGSIKHVPHYYHPLEGCFLQLSDGRWQQETSSPLP